MLDPLRATYAALGKSCFHTNLKRFTQTAAVRELRTEAVVGVGFQLSGSVMALFCHMIGFQLGQDAWNEPDLRIFSTRRKSPRCTLFGQGHAYAWLAVDVNYLTSKLNSKWIAEIDPVLETAYNFSEIADY